MATPANEGGMGGPSRRQPFRRAPSTPYDRPPAALRGARRGRHAAEGGGWISKLVDPAHRLISSAASKLFSSMFRKRLTAPPASPACQVILECRLCDYEEDRQSREDVSQIAQFASTTPSSGIQNGDGDNRTSNSDSGGIAEVEQLLKDKTFTRVESDRLAELLRSRTVDTFKAEHEHNDLRKIKASLQAQEDGIGSSKEHIPRDEAASPAELAKAYMTSRPSKVSPSVGSLRNQIFQEDANLPNLPYTSRRLDHSVAPRSVIRFSGVPEHPEHGYQTARPPGRSAIYRMSRSPYFKVGELSRDGYPSPSLSQWTPSVMKSGGKQVLKRRSSPLDGDSPSRGPIRRIRQKSNLISPFKDARTPLSGSQVTINGISNATMLPSTSSETAQKLFQQLDKLLPSPKERSSEMKTVARDETPSKLTLDMLHGSALRSMEDMNSSKFFSMQGSGKFETANASHLPNIGNSHSQKLDMVEENGCSKAVHLEVKLASEANGVSNAPIPSKDAKPRVRSEYLSAASSVALPVPKRPAFQMSVSEDSLELDDNDYNTRDLSSSLATIKDDADIMMSKRNDVISETAISENSRKTSSQSMPISSSLSSRRADKKAPIQPVVTEKNNGFAFPVASDPCTRSQPPPTPTMPTPMLDKPDVQKEQTSPVFSFGSKGANSSTFPSTTISTAGIKVGEGLGSEPILSSSATTASTEGSTLVETQKAGDTFKSLGNTVSSGISASSGPAVFTFGTSTSHSLANGSLSSSLPTLPVHGTAAVTPSEGHVSSIFGNGGAAAASSSGSSVSAAVATFSTAPSFQFGSGISTTATVSVSQPLDKSNSATLEANSLKASSFSISGSTVQGTSAVFPSSGSSSSSDAATSVTIFSSVGSSSPTLSPSLMSSGMSSSSSASSSLFSSIAGSNSSLALSSSFPSTGNGVFGFNVTTQPAFSSSSFAHSSQNSTSNLLGSTGGSTSSSPLFANSSSQNSTASTFSDTGGSIFGTQSSGSIFGTQSSGSIFGTQPSQSGSGASQTTQSSTSQFGSFPSSPSFGLGNSSSGGYGISSFAPATSGAKPLVSSSGFSFSSGVGSSSASSSSYFVPAATTGLFGSSSQESTTSLFSSSSSSNTSSSMGFSFGSSASGSGSSPFTFGSSSTTVFSFTSAGATAPPSAQAPVFGMPSPAVGFTSMGNDQMNDDNMTDDANQSASALVPTFGQPANPPPSQPFVFGSSAIQPGSLPAFQFGSHQNLSAPQNPSPFQSAGNVEFTGGSFSLGSEGGGDKSGRKFVKVRRDNKHRAKKSGL